MADTPHEFEISDRFLLALLRQAESATSTGREAVAAAPVTGPFRTVVRKPVMHFPRSLRLLSRHPRSEELTGNLVKPSGTATALRYEELERLESMVPIASNYPDRSATSVAGLAYHLRRLRALRGVAAVDELRALPTFWRWVLLLDADQAQEFVERLGRAVDFDGGLGLDQPFEQRPRPGMPTALTEPLSRALVDAVKPSVEALRDRFDMFSARGIALLAVVWRQGSASGADLAVKVGRSDIGIVLSRLQPAVVSADDYRQIARVARKVLLRLFADADSVGGGAPVMIEE